MLKKLACPAESVGRGDKNSQGHQHAEIRDGETVTNPQITNTK